MVIGPRAIYGAKTGEVLDRVLPRSQEERLIRQGRIEKIEPDPVPGAGARTPPSRPALRGNALASPEVASPETRRNF